jgi:U3 small nucleolar ribonucleoprotein protein IMP4
MGPSFHIYVPSCSILLATRNRPRCFRGMIRRNVRLRKEYLYRKSLAGKESELYEKKRQIKDAIEQGKSIPTELQSEEAALRADLAWDDERSDALPESIDDEYAYAGARDPKICVTTSRDPSSRLKAFCKEIKLLFPNSQRVNRGNHKVPELVEVCRSNDFTDIVMVQETRGEPDGLVVCHLPFGPTAFFTLRNCVQRHDIENCGAMSEAFPQLILNNFESKLGARLANVLRCLFPVPKPDSKRVITFSNEDDHIAFRHHTFERDGREVTLQEVGPRFDLQLYKLRLGTIDQEEADNEYVLRPFMNSSKRRKVLS